MAMERKRSKPASVLLWAAVAALFSQNLVMPVMSAIDFEDQKNFFYTPVPSTSTPPTVSYTPPIHANPTPSHGSYGGSPPANCGNPGSGGHHAPSPPKRSGSGYHHSPPSSTPTTPTIVRPPTAPIVVPRTPSTPGITIPSPPFPFDPNSPPFTCTYWRNHPTLIWGLFGWWATIGNAFGVTSLPGTGPHMNLLQALSNTRADGIGELYREGTAALLNSMTHPRFPYTTTHVRDSFVAALSSNKAAAAQAQLFKLANEDSRLMPKLMFYHLNYASYIHIFLFSCNDNKNFAGNGTWLCYRRTVKSRKSNLSHLVASRKMHSALKLGVQRIFLWCICVRTRQLSVMDVTRSVHATLRKQDSLAL
ncbi:UNVERIFIED_CONTAM: Protodermal factor 1 [Sesamum calycinum]|uniref:Protodermal factor 1 n=1 Tax=Sesamum calycinum TaxID=2727403 RepID=A0AAW2M9Y4_9LAMI